VVLPPEGRYGVLMGKPWTPEAQPQRADRSGFAIVDGGSLRLDSGLRVAPGERVRIVFAD
jgi:hypothetical protein